MTETAISLWRRTGGTWAGLDAANVEQWIRSDGAMGRVNVSSTKMAGGLGEGFGPGFTSIETSVQFIPFDALVSNTIVCRRCGADVTDAWSHTCSP